MSIEWSNLTQFGIAAMLLWLLGALLSFRNQNLGAGVFAGGVVVFISFVALFWISMGRAPLRTMGETRLWYSLFVSLVSLLLFIRWRFSFLLPFGAILASVFTIINIARPEIHNVTLMPALQSAWFVPHVTVYMLAYAILAVGLVAALFSILQKNELMKAADVLTRIGASLILIGMIMGAVWAKQAWGDYWAWDAKENWAVVTWLLYVTYLHLRARYSAKRGLAITVLTIAFIALQITWYGVNHLPAAQKSMHTYTMN